MQYAEALREVKKAEAEVRELKAESQRQASQILRDAERQANALLDKARAEADAAHASALEAATRNAEKERTKLMQAGQTAATAILGRASSPDFKAAADLLLTNFEQHVTGK